MSFALATSFLSAATALLPPKPEEAYFEKFDPKPAPQPDGLLLKKGDRLAILGDSITERKMYSRYMGQDPNAGVPGGGGGLLVGAGGGLVWAAGGGF